MTESKISVHRRRKCRFDFESENKIVGGRRGKFAKSLRAEMSLPPFVMAIRRESIRNVTSPHHGDCVMITIAK